MNNLCLTRRKGEHVLVVVDGIVIAKVTLLKTTRADAMLAFEANPHVKFYRSEVWERVQQAMESDESILKGKIND